MTKMIKRTSSNIRKAIREAGSKEAQRKEVKTKKISDETKQKIEERITLQKWIVGLRTIPTC